MLKIILKHFHESLTWRCVSIHLLWEKEEALQIFPIFPLSKTVWGMVQLALFILISSFFSFLKKCINWRCWSHAVPWMPANRSLQQFQGCIPFCMPNSNNREGPLALWNISQERPSFLNTSVTHDKLQIFESHSISEVFRLLNILTDHEH